MPAGTVHAFTAAGLVPVAVLAALAATLVAGLAGVIAAWILRRRTDLSIRNLYLAVGILLLIDSIVIAAGVTVLMVALAPVTAFAATGSLVGRRARLADLGAGDDLRQHELARRWLWQPSAADRHPGQRTHIGASGELVRRVPWPAHVPSVPMSADPAGPRLPCGEGMHVFTVGATGAGKTTSAHRLAAGRVLQDHTALLVVDGKGDRRDERVLRNLAAAAHVPFILFDPRDPDTDRWQPLRDAPADVIARAIEPIESSETYYPDMLRRQLAAVTDILHSVGMWPPSLPLLADAAVSDRWDDLLALASGHTADPAVFDRADRHTRWVKRYSDKTLSSADRLDVVLGQAWRPVLTPRPLDDGTAVAVNLVRAIRQRAVVLWRTYSDDMPNEARAATVLALADVHAAAGQADSPWTLMLDEFGAVIKTAGNRAVGLLQRGRSHHGQVIVITQSVADIDALSQQPGLLESMSDNFRAFVIHRQVAPTSREWCAKLCGTRGLWQSTDAMQGDGVIHSGRGSRRRVQEFRVHPNEIARLPDREAFIYTTLGPDPARCNILRAAIPDGDPERIGDGSAHACEAPVHPAISVPRATPEAEAVATVEAVLSTGADDI
ncbi:MAG: type IV secretion system DNA-binding domain-containing protein [Solirubrobacteraceae bacterium]|jgi:hypothetical protein